MGRLFGTDGVRGIANAELSCARAYEIGRAAGAVLSEGCRRRPVFCVGGDTRISTPMLSAAICAGLCSVGADVFDLGIVPTPAVAFLIGKLKADAGIVITASHNPFEYNGIKIFGGDGRKLPDMIEDRIESIVLDRAGTLPCPEGGEIGRISRVPNAQKLYVDHVKGTAMYSLGGLNVVLDCANGAASATAHELFSSLGANVKMLSDKPNGTNVNENCGSTHIDAISEAVRRGGFDCGVAFDGDADRCLCVDERGELVDGDRIMAICALDLFCRGRLEKNTVVGTVMTNLGFIKFCEEHGLRFIATKVGDRFVLEEMLLEGYSFGGEQSGHIIFSDFATTGDGQLTAVQLLSLMCRTKKSLSELASVMKTFPQTFKNIAVTPEGKLKFYTDKRIEEAIALAKAELGQSGRIVVRPSGTEPLIRVMVEGEDKEKIEEVASRTEKVIRDVLDKQ